VTTTDDGLAEKGKKEGTYSRTVPAHLQETEIGFEAGCPQFGPQLVDHLQMHQV